MVLIYFRANILNLISKEGKNTQRIRGNNAEYMCCYFAELPTNAQNCLYRGSNCFRNIFYELNNLRIITQRA